VGRRFGGRSALAKVAPLRMRAILYSSIILTFTVTYAFFLDFVGIRGVKPDILLIFAAVTGARRGATEGAAVGLACGAVKDLLSSGFFGINMLLLLYVGLLPGLINERVQRENVLALLTVTLFLSAAYESSVFLVTFYFGRWVGLGHAMASVIVPQALYTAAVAAMLYAPLLLVYGLIERNEKKYSRL